LVLAGPVSSLARDHRYLVLVDHLVLRDSETGELVMEYPSRGGRGEPLDVMQRRRSTSPSLAEIAAASAGNGSHKLNRTIAFCPETTSSPAFAGRAARYRSRDPSNY
jgi:hypothetical protein